MNDIYDDCDDDIIELTEDELKEILADEDFDADYEAAPIPNTIFPIPTRMPIAPTMHPREKMLFYEHCPYIWLFIERLRSKNTVCVD